ncbi:hypothetical protein [Pontibacter roseus]|uniref:hypothetical protein n=1 Tax=Pontibacter roseus TaxID=336989 RepID=UPI00037A6A5D|nr:hypothetical protein [Pontibacter roseus]
MKAGIAGHRQHSSILLKLRLASIPIGVFAPEQETMRFGAALLNTNLYNIEQL